MDKEKIADGSPGGEGMFLDPASGVHTRGFFLVTLDRELVRCARYGEPITVALLELEGGGPGGQGQAESRLKSLGNLVRTNIREVDLVARYDSHVFAVLLLRASAEVAWIVGERVLRALEVSFAGVYRGYIGMVSYPRDGSDAGALLERAADALGRARGGGKSGVFYFKREASAAAIDRPKVLVVDDELRNVKLLEAQLLPMNYEVIRASSGRQALALAQSSGVDLVLLDVMMPGMDGFEVCRRLKSLEPTRNVPVVMVSALEDLESKVKGIQAGADDFLTKPANREELLARTRSLIHLRMLNKNLVSIESALFSLANAVEAKDNYTKDHTQRVAGLAVALGARLGLSEKDLSALRLGGILHDVGKIGVPEAILNKPGKLDEDEWVQMQAHTDLGYKICLPLLETIGPALDVIRHHHEKLDGSSYPDHLKGDAISMLARIMSAVDAYDALISDRPYRKAMSRAEAFAVLRAEVQDGKMDGSVVAALEHLESRKPEPRQDTLPEPTWA
jgi:putative two-component system response regulator